MVAMVSNGLDGVDGGSSGFRKGLFWGSQGGVVLRAPEGPFFGVQASLGVPKGCFLGPTFVV